MRHARVIAALLCLGLAVCALAVDLPGDEATNRRMLKTFLDDPDHAERLKKNLAAFQAMPAAEQARIRQLDEALRGTDTTTRNRLHEVMERYAGWLARLPDADRGRIAAAEAGHDRLAVVNEILERQWLESLPRYDRTRLAVAEPLERAMILEELHQREDEWRRLRADSHRKVEEQTLYGSLPVERSDFRTAVQHVVDEPLRPLLNDREEARLNTTRPNTFRQMQVVAELIDGRIPVDFPGPTPPGRKKAIRYWKDVPAEIVKKLPAKDQTNPPPAITKAEGKWPDLPLAVVDLARDRKVEIPTHLLGPTKLNELPPSVQKFVKDELTPALSADEEKQLTTMEGRWPEFPKKVKELAMRHNLVVPGISLPGEREAWRRLREIKPGRVFGGN